MSSRNSAPSIDTFLILLLVKFIELRTVSVGNITPVNLVYDKSTVFKLTQFDKSRVCDSVDVPNLYELVQLRCLKYLLLPIFRPSIRFEYETSSSSNLSAFSILASVKLSVCNLLICLILPAPVIPISLFIPFIGNENNAPSYSIPVSGSLYLDSGPTYPVTLPSAPEPIVIVIYCGE